MNQQEQWLAEQRRLIHIGTALTIGAGLWGLLCAAVGIPEMGIPVALAGFYALGDRRKAQEMYQDALNIIARMDAQEREAGR